MSTRNGKSSQLDLWNRLLGSPRPEVALHLAMHHAANLLSDLANRSIKLANLQLEQVMLDDLLQSLDDPEAETVGVYLRVEDDLPGQALLMLSPGDAMYMADWLLEARPGTTTWLGALEYSALAEAGNVVLSAFLNAMAEFTGTLLRPSTPAVTVDMLATFLEILAASVSYAPHGLFIIKADFKDLYDSLDLRFWVMPDPAWLNLQPPVPTEPAA